MRRTLTQALDRGRRLLAERSGRRGMAGATEISVVAAGAVLVTGVFFGTGLDRTAVEIADGLTWLSDSPTGEVVQVNPATGLPELRLEVGADGDELDVTQYDGHLVVTNRTTGEITSYDLARLLVAGQRRVAVGDATDLLVHDGDVFLLDRSQRTISSIDPLTTDAIGERWLSEPDLADGAIDGEGALWALDAEGLLTELAWSDESAAFTTEGTREVENSAAGSVLVGHERGVTVFGPDAGLVVQEGTGDDLVADTPGLTGELLAARTAPSDLVPVSSPDAGLVHIVHDGRVVEVDVAAAGCSSPGRPAVYLEQVFVPCPGDGKVLRLTGDGERAAADLVTPGGDPELVLDDDNLFVNVPGADTGLVVRPDGSVDDVQRDVPGLGTTRPGGVPATPTPPPVTGPPDDPRDPDGSDRDEDRSDIDRDPPAGINPGTRPPPGTIDADPPLGDDRPPTGNGPGNGPGDSGRPGPGGPGGPGDPDDPGTSPPGTDPTDCTVDPTAEGCETEPPAASPLTAPSGVTATATAPDRADVTWDHAAPAAGGFTVTDQTGATLVTVGGDARSASVAIAPGVPTTFVVTATRGQESQASAPSSPVTGSGPPGAPGAVTVTAPDPRPAFGAGTATMTISWGASSTNGSPVTGYRVIVNGGAPQTVTGTSTTANVPCNDDGVHRECDWGTVTASVVATSAAGDSGATQGSNTAPAGTPRPPPLPGGGRQHVTSSSTDAEPISYEGGSATTTLQVAPPADWSAFTGTCSYIHSGNTGFGGGGGAETVNVACDATTVQVDVRHDGIARSQNGGPVDRGHSVVFRADNGEGTVDSQTYSWTVAQQTLCQTCPVP